MRFDPVRIPTGALGGFLLAGLASGAVAGDTRSVSLVTQDGAPVAVAELKVDGDGRYALRWDESKFGDFFLSMRPFRCLEGAEKLWCRLPYPYENRRRLSDGDLVDLEYDLMFVWKNAGEYGIDFWNGVYYRLSAGADGALTGAMHEIDMNVLAAPPSEGDLRPIAPDMLEEADPSSHWLPRLRIE